MKLAPLYRRPQRAPLTLPPWEDTGRSWLPMKQEVGPHLCLDLGLTSLQNREEETPIGGSHQVWSLSEWPERTNTSPLQSGDDGNTCLYHVVSCEEPKRTSEDREHWDCSGSR